MILHVTSRKHVNHQSSDKLEDLSKSAELYESNDELLQRL